ncbi:oxidoreductaseshort chain dehydrogenase/reductase family [Aphelenchoides avenae]|nr:oxidoreductaseshort chain dehydrogenase/reductase family [Aphelenchus avenae]
MSKAALDRWSKDSAAKYAPAGIRVNTVSPGPIRTEFIKRHGVVGDAYQQMEDKLATHTLLRRVGTPQEISRNILHLASDDASFITGATLVIDGGVLSRPIS